MEQSIQKQRNIGILGGGQLAMMMTEAALRLGHKVLVLDPTPHCPASRVGAHQTIGSFHHHDDIMKFSEKVDVLTWDIESVNVDTLLQLQKENVGLKINPDPSFLEIIQNKWTQKSFYLKNNLPTATIYPTNYFNNEKNIHQFPVVLKTKYGGYDGRGVWIVDSMKEMSAIMTKSGLPEEQFYVEKLVELKDEYSIILCSGLANEQSMTVKHYPVTKLIQKNGICIETQTPSGLESNVETKIKQIGNKILESMEDEFDFSYFGILAIELFLTTNDEILINEISPRVHNSGHYTIEGCMTSQFENHIRAITQMRLGQCDLICPSDKAIIMENILSVGNAEMDSPFYFTKNKIDENIRIHWYHKQPKNGTVDTLYAPKRKIGHFTYFTTHVPNENGPKPVIPLVHVIMGSSSDLGQMEGCIHLLEEYNIPHKVDIVSAHRSPGWMFRFGKDVESWGARVVIAAAGGAAHLPGMVASLTNLPVIGVPIETKNLGGQDSLYSIVQMPDGVPVATVGIGKSKNAAILAIKILGRNDVLVKLKKANLLKVENQRKSIQK